MPLSGRSPGDGATADLSGILFHIAIEIAKAGSLRVISAYLFLTGTAPGALKWE